MQACGQCWLSFGMPGCCLVLATVTRVLLMYPLLCK